MFKKRTRAKDTPSPHSSTAGSDQSWSIEVLHGQRPPESAAVPAVRLRTQPNGRLKVLSCTCALYAENGSCLDLWAATMIIATFPQGSVEPPNGLMIHIDWRGVQGRSPQLATPKAETQLSDKEALRNPYVSRGLVAADRLNVTPGRLSCGCRFS
jgi:hypothetical protein